MCFMCGEHEALILLMCVIIFSTLGNCNSRFTKLLFNFKNSSILLLKHYVLIQMISHTM